MLTRDIGIALASSRKVDDSLRHEIVELHSTQIETRRRSVGPGWSGGTTLSRSHGAHLKMVEGRTIATISWRILPLAAVAYCVAYIDRTNVSFAALTMNKGFGISAYVYGAGIFFLSHFLFERRKECALNHASKGIPTYCSASEAWA